MAPEFTDPRMTSIKPRIRYNTIGGVNGPLVFLDNVCFAITATVGKEVEAYSWRRSNFRDIMRLSL
jgi:hypothetical protein